MTPMLSVGSRRRYKPEGPIRVFVIVSSISSRELVTEAAAELSRLLDMEVEQVRIPQEADALLLGSGGVEERVLDIMESHSAPRLLLAGPSYNAYAAGIEALAAWRQMGGQGHLEGVFEHNASRVCRWITAQRVLRRLYGRKIGLIGGSAPWLVASKASSERLESRFGMSIVHVPWDEEGVRACVASAVEDVESTLAELEEGVLADAPMEVAPESVAACIGIKRWLDSMRAEYGFDAMAVNCFQLVKLLGHTPCLALSMLNEAGFVAACEGDVTSLVAMMIGRELAADTAWMANAVLVRDKNVSLAHCVAAPGIGDSVAITTHFETGAPCSLAVELPLGAAVTLFRFDAELSRMCVREGTTVPCSVSEGARCRTAVDVQLERRMVPLLGNHHVMVFGRFARSLECVAGLLDVSVE